MLQCYYTFVFVYCCNFNQLLYCNSMLVTTCNVCIVQPYRPSIPYTRVCDGFLFVVFENPTFNFNNPRNKKIGTRSNLKLSCLSIVPRWGEKHNINRYSSICGYSKPWRGSLHPKNKVPIGIITDV